MAALGKGWYERGAQHKPVRVGSAHCNSKMRRSWLRGETRDPGQSVKQHAATLGWVKRGKHGPWVRAEGRVV